MDGHQGPLVSTRQFACTELPRTPPYNESPPSYYSIVTIQPVPRMCPIKPPHERGTGLWHLNYVETQQWLFVALTTDDMMPREAAQWYASLFSGRGQDLLDLEPDQLMELWPVQVARLIDRARYWPGNRCSETEQTPPPPYEEPPAYETYSRERHTARFDPAGGNLPIRPADLWRLNNTQVQEWIIIALTWVDGQSRPEAEAYAAKYAGSGEMLICMPNTSLKKTFGSESVAEAIMRVRKWPGNKPSR